MTDIAHGSAPLGTTGYWLIQNSSTGHAVVSYGSDPTSSTIMQALGASSDSQLKVYGWTGSFLDGMENALDQVGVQTDTLPPQYSPASGTDIMGINFDFLKPVGAGPGYQQGIQQAGQNIQNVVNFLGDGWMAFVIRILEALAGVLLIALGLSALAGVSDGDPVRAVKRAGAAIPLWG
jgi:hypothetical protein